MQKNPWEYDDKEGSDLLQKAQEQKDFKNQNPNQNHNVKKVALGTHTKR